MLTLVDEILRYRNYHYYYYFTAISVALKFGKTWVTKTDMTMGTMEVIIMQLQSLIAITVELVQEKKPMFQHQLVLGF